jgi:hypothetical protein
MANTQAQSGPERGLAEPGLLRLLAENWWLLLLRGFAAIVFGVLAFFWPGLTLITLTWLWGAYALSDGVIAIWAAFNASGGDVSPRWWLGLSGVVGILAGVGALAAGRADGGFLELLPFRLRDQCVTAIRRQKTGHFEYIVLKPTVDWHGGLLDRAPRSGY